LVDFGLGFLLPPHGWKDRIIQVDEAFVTPLVATAFLNLLLDTWVPYIVAKIAHRHAMLERKLRHKLEKVGLTPAIMHRISAKAMFHLLPKNLRGENSKADEEDKCDDDHHEKLFHNLHTNANIVMKLIRKRAKIRQNKSKKRKKKKLRMQNIVNAHFKELLRKSHTLVQRTSKTNAVAKMVRGMKRAVKSTENIVKKVKKKGVRVVKTGTGQLKEGVQKSFEAVKMTTLGLGRQIHAGIHSRRLHVIAEIENTFHEMWKIAVKRHGDIETST
jgi:hypothetical protein